MPSLKELEDKVTSAISDEILYYMSFKTKQGLVFKAPLSPMAEVPTMLLGRTLAEPIVQHIADTFREGVSEEELDAIKHEAVLRVGAQLILNKQCTDAKIEKEAAKAAKQALEDQDFIKALINRALERAVEIRNKETIATQLLNLHGFQPERPEGREIKLKTARTVASAILELGEGVFSQELLRDDDTKAFLERVSSIVQQIKGSSSNREELREKLLKDTRFIAAVNAWIDDRSIVSSDLEFESPRLPASAPPTPRKTRQLSRETRSEGGTPAPQKDSKPTVDTIKFERRPASTPPVPGSHRPRTTGRPRSASL